MTAFTKRIIITATTIIIIIIRSFESHDEKYIKEYIINVRHTLMRIDEKT